jgi:Right handed beta helix region
MKKLYCSCLAWIFTWLLAGNSAFGQGLLTPSGAPAPTMKTLDQVQPRIPITSLPINITQPGSYYLTQSFAQIFQAQAIFIQTNNVTIDLCGFTVQSTGGGGVTGISISSLASVGITNVQVRNGTITGFTAAGIKCFGTRNCIFEDLAVTECGATGLDMQDFGSYPVAGNVVRRCRFCDNGGSGVALGSSAADIQNVFENCDSINNTSAGFALAAPGNFIMNCRASGNANNYVITGGNRGGVIVLPTANSVAISGASGGLGTGSTDPYVNLSY